MLKGVITMLFEMTPFDKNFQKMSRDFFDDFDRNFFAPIFTSTASVRHFQTDIRDNGDSFLLEADLPGFRKEDISAEIKDHLLTIKAERHSDFEDKDKKTGYVRQERTYGSYLRSFNVDGIDESQIKASYTDGVLKLTLPKLAPQEPAKQTIIID